METFDCPACYYQQITLNPEELHGKTIVCAACAVRIQVLHEPNSALPYCCLEVAPKEVQDFEAMREAVKSTDTDWMGNPLK